MPAKFVNPPNSAEQEIEETNLIADSSVSKVLVPAEAVIEDNNEDISSVSLPSSSSQSGKIGDGSIIQDGRSTFSEKVVGGRKVKRCNYSGKATHMAKSWKCRRLQDTIKSMGTIAEQAEAVTSVLKLPSMQPLAKKIRLKLLRTIKAAVYNQKQLKRAVQQVAKTSKIQG